jgi:hypothetical protein
VAVSTRRRAAGQPRSVAVDSRRFDAALFLAPAVKPVMALIERFKIVGGLHRYAVAGGDFYPVRTSVGTYILIRRETGTEQAANPYLVVPSAVSQAWSLAVSRSEDFLWPMLRHENGKEIYDFYTDASPSRVAYSFPYQPSDTPEPELSEATGACRSAATSRPVITSAAVRRPMGAAAGRPFGW